MRWSQKDCRQYGSCRFVLDKYGEWERDFSHLPWGPPSFLYSGYRVSLPGVKRSGRGVNHPPPSSAEVKERQELYLFSTSRLSWLVLGWNSPLNVFYWASLWNLIESPALLSGTPIMLVLPIPWWHNTNRSARDLIFRRLIMLTFRV
jgi:hypothetical protein